MLLSLTFHIGTDPRRADRRAAQAEGAHPSGAVLRPANLPAATGAARPVILGKIVPGREAPPPRGGKASVG